MEINLSYLGTVNTYLKEQWKKKFIQWVSM